jgi:flavodoxin
MRALVVFYSLSGTTRTVAEAIARQLDADLEEVRPRIPYAGITGLVRAVIDSLRGGTPELAPASRNPAAYDLVLVGGPIWASRPAPPIAAFLANHSGRLQRVAFFVSHGGSAPDRAFRIMQERAGKAPEGTLALKADAVKSGAFRAEADRFVERLRQPKAA